MEIIDGHLIGEPDLVGRTIKSMSLLVHLACLDLEDYQFAMALSDLGRGILVLRKVDVMAAALDQAQFANAIEVAGGGAMKKVFWWFLGHIIQFYFDAMSLLGPDKLSSVGSEHLPYKQGVTGSSPVLPTRCKHLQRNL
jgi:hypothetical protein